MTHDERIPESELSAAFAPVPYIPSTQLAAATQPPPRQWSEDDMRVARDFLTRVVRTTFDALDNVGDSIATAIGLR